MSDLAPILAAEGCMFGGAGLIVGLCLSADRIIVAVLRYSGLPLYPLAVSIAVLIYQHPEQWTGDTHRLSHPKVGSIWTGNQTYGIAVESDFGKWKPNWIERRIIREAVDWRIRAYVRNRITQAMRLPSP